MSEAEDRKKAKQTALRMLAYRGRSKQEIKGRLCEKGFASKIIQETLDYLSAYGYVDDQAYARELALSLCTHKGWGFGRIAYTLQSRGIPADMVDETISALKKTHSEEETASAIVKRRFSHIDFSKASPREKHRVISFLQRRGFSWTTINQITRL